MQSTNAANAEEEHQCFYVMKIYEYQHALGKAVDEIDLYR